MKKTSFMILFACVFFAQHACAVKQRKKENSSEGEGKLYKPGDF